MKILVSLIFSVLFYIYPISGLANTQIVIKPEKKIQFHRAKVFKDLLSCLQDLRVTYSNPVKYESGVCLQDKEGYIKMRIIFPGDFSNVIRRFREYVNQDLWLSFLARERRGFSREPIRMPDIEIRSGFYD